MSTLERRRSEPLNGRIVQQRGLGRTLWIALCCGVVASAVHMHAVQNRFAMDDVPIIRDNPAAHSVPQAFRAWLQPYWPRDSSGASAGQYRPFTILSFAVDWSATGGSTGWLHATNVVIHGVVTALAVFVLSAWLTALGLWTAGLIFAVHPVHVEAVAGLVGRAELLAGGAMLGAVLAARRFRATSNVRPRWFWSFCVVALVLAGLFSKEHAVVVIAVLALDHVLTDRSGLRRNAGLYLAVAGATLAWLYLFRGVAGQFVEGSRAALFRGLSDARRLATMLPVQLDVIRLLTWPFDLVSDYNPQTVVQRTGLDWIGGIGGAAAVAIVALAIALHRRAPAITFGVLAGIMTYAPTSNILFASGVSLAERNLYLAVLAPAAALAWLVARSSQYRIGRWVLVGVGALAIAFATRTVERVRAWEDTRSIVIEDIVEHPENYRTRLRLASYFTSTGNTAAALAEGRVAAALFPDDAFISTRTVPWAIQLGYQDLALEEARRAHAEIPKQPVLARLLVESHLALGRGGQPHHFDSALAVAQVAMNRAPHSEIPIQDYEEILATLGAAEWKRVLNQARMHYVHSRFGQATAALERGVLSYRETPHRGIADCWDLGRALTMARELAPWLSNDLEDVQPPSCPALQF